MSRETAGRQASVTAASTTRGRRTPRGALREATAKKGRVPAKPAQRGRTKKSAGDPEPSRSPSWVSAPATAGAVTMQARVDADFVELLKTDALVLGLTGMSEVVREGLRLVHKRARELALAAEYDRFYGSQPAPLPEGVVPADAE